MTVEKWLKSCRSDQNDVLCDSDPGETGKLCWVAESEVDPHHVQASGLKEKKTPVLEMANKIQEEVCWGRKADGAGKHEESRALVVAVLVPEETAASDGVEAPEPDADAAGKHPMTPVELLQKSLPEEQEDVVTLRNNDTAAGCPSSHSSPSGGLPLTALHLPPLKLNHFRCHFTSYRSSSVHPAPLFLFPV